MANATATELQQLYIAYFGRAADPTGLEYWTVEKPTTTKAFAANMYAQPEFKSVYGSLSIEAQVNQIYQNLFERDADPTGLTYWANEIRTGSLELASIANDLIWAVNNSTGGTEEEILQRANDLSCLTNKTSAAVAYTAEVEKTTAGIIAYAPASLDPFIAGSNIEEAKSFMDAVDKDTKHTETGVTTSVSTITTNGALTEAEPTTYTLTSDSPSITEGDTGTKTLVYTLNLDKAATEDLNVNYETLTTGTATAGDDFVKTAGTVSFAKGQQTATVNVTVNNDTTYENSGDPETVVVKFSGSSLVADVTATGSIKENDSVPVVVTPTTYTLTSDSPSITEGDTGTKTLAFTITLDQAATEETTVNYETLTTGTATAGDDFVVAASQVTFAKGQKTAIVNVTVNNDTTYENSGDAETVVVKFSGSQLVADVTATGSIKENDSAPVVVPTTYTLTSDSPSITEGDTGTKTLVYTLNLDKAAEEVLNVNYETLTTGTATAGDDFVATSGQATFAKGQKNSNSQRNC